MRTTTLLAAAALLGLLAVARGHDGPDNALVEARVAALEDLLQHVSRGGGTVTISGANLRIVDGSGDTDGPTNGLGNLIVGYNERRPIAGREVPFDPNVRTGSHMLVVGKELNYSSYGGIVAGLANTTGARFATVCGGRENRALDWASSVSGGRGNAASRPFCAVRGGLSNVAGGFFPGGIVRSWASVGGGMGNLASAVRSSVAGGTGNWASGNAASVSAGWQNIAGFEFGSASGGLRNVVLGIANSITGGAQNLAMGTVGNTVSGGRFNGATAGGVFASSTVSGGRFNLAAREHSSVSGGSGTIVGPGAANPHPDTHD